MWKLVGLKASLIPLFCSDERSSSSVRQIESRIVSLHSNQDHYAFQTNWLFCDPAIYSETHVNVSRKVLARSLTLTIERKVVRMRGWALLDMKCDSRTWFCLEEWARIAGRWVWQVLVRRIRVPHLLNISSFDASHRQCWHFSWRNPSRCLSGCRSYLPFGLVVRNCECRRKILQQQKCFLLPPIRLSASNGSLFRNGNCLLP